MNRTCLAAFLAVALFTGVAHADQDASSSGNAFAASSPGSIMDNGPHERPMNLSVMAYVPWYYGIGIGADVRFEIPVVKNGFIPKLNNSFSIEPSLSLAYSTWYDFSNVHVVNITPAVYGVWNFYFTKQFSAYGGLGLGYNIGIVSDDNGFVSGDFFFWDVVVGIHYKFGEHIALRAELGDEALKAGLSFYF